ncbi:hypothetical protein C437_01790, partial [Haloarcula vallismortis ATCC 29715]
MNQFIGTGPYKQDGAGNIWPPGKNSDNYPENFVENLREYVEQDHIEEPFLGSWDVGSFETDEIYVDEDHSTGKKYLEIAGQVDGAVSVVLKIPVVNNS